MLGGNNFLNPAELMSIIQLNEGDFVADLGCGSGGYFVIPFAKKVGQTGRVYAVDVLPEAIQTVETATRVNNLTNVKTVWADLEVTGSSKIPSNSLDEALLINVLFQNKKRDDIIKEASKMVKQDGLLVIVDWLVSGTGFGPDENILVDRSHIEGLVLGLNYEKVYSDNIGEYHFVDIYKKL